MALPNSFVQTILMDYMREHGIDPASDEGKLFLVSLGLIQSPGGSGGSSTDLANSESYTDSSVGSEASARTSGDAATLVSANAYTDSHSSAPLTTGAYFTGGLPFGGAPTTSAADDSDWLFGTPTTVKTMRFVLPFSIVVNKTSMVPGIEGGGQYGIGLYSADGNTLVLEHIRSSAQDGDLNLIAPITLQAGVYVFAWAADGSGMSSMVSEGFYINPQQGPMNPGIVGLAANHYNDTTHRMPATLGTITPNTAMKTIPAVYFKN